MKKDVTNAGKNTNGGKTTDDYNVWKRMSLMLMNTDDYNVWKTMSLMQVRILMIIMYEKGCH